MSLYAQYILYYAHIEIESKQVPVHCMHQIILSVVNKPIMLSVVMVIVTQQVGLPEIIQNPMIFGLFSKIRTNLQCIVISN
jgi:hypothetical protein